MSLPPDNWTEDTLESPTRRKRGGVGESGVVQSIGFYNYFAAGAADSQNFFYRSSLPAA